MIRFTMLPKFNSKSIVNCQSSRRLVLLLCFMFGLLHELSAQQNVLSPAQQQQARTKAVQNMMSRSGEARKQWYSKHSSRLPIKKKLADNQSGEEQRLQSLSPQAPGIQMPTKFSVPGEFEESQAAFLSWPYSAFDADGNLIDPITKDYGYLESNGDYTVVPIVGFEIDTIAGDYPLAPKWAELANAIQKELPVWIILYNAPDTAIVKTYMANMGMPLTNYRFFIVGGGNAFWTRDFGPIGFYYGDQDSVGFIDPIYYIERAADDSLPDILAKQLGYLNVRTQLKFEGGNFMCDGEGIGFTSSMIDTINAERNVQVSIKYNSTTKKYLVNYPVRTAWNAKKTLDTLQAVFGLKQGIVLQTLLDDGGTGHIDMYTKLFDQETILSTAYPEAFNNSSFRDYKIGNKGIATEKSTKTSFDKNFNVFTLPVPTSDSGEYDSTSSDTFFYDPRGYLNGLTINKTFIFPSFSSGGNGNEQELQQVMELYKQYVPGYKLVPIDSRILTPMAGAIHCITMQVPAENPLRIHHAAWRGSVNSLPNYPVLARITNRSGIAKAQIKWRVKGASEWKSVDLVNDSASSFSAAIPGDQGAADQTIEYFIEAKAKNNKQQTLPITAPDGYYSFRFGSAVGVSEDIRTTGSDLVFPNPSLGTLSVPLDLLHPGFVKLEIVDMQGQIVQSHGLGLLAAGLSVPRIVTENLVSGVYALRVFVDNKLSDVRRFVQD